MAAEVKKEIELEIAHVLFLDVVGYSKLSVNEQHDRVEELNEIVRLSEQFRNAEAAGRLLKIPTGDGMALVFYKSPEEPAQCAVEISRALKDNGRLQVRMGIHNGPVSGVVDVTERTNVAGAGVNMAQRVMDCGDAGHILLSRHVAEDLAEYQRWRPFLHDIGTFEVKHGVRVSVTNLFTNTTETVAGTAPFNAFSSAISQGQFENLNPGQTVSVPVSIDPAEFAKTPALGLMVVATDNAAGGAQAILLEAGAGEDDSDNIKEKG